MVRLFLVVGNTYYALTTRRLMLRSGFWGTDFKSIDFDQIADLEVNVNPIENAYGVGSIRAYSGGMSNRGRPAFDSFLGIANPYQVFKQIKEAAIDVKTDWSYPNALRPGVNPGYHTRYKQG
jgi:Bacterial PH domain